MDGEKFAGESCLALNHFTDSLIGEGIANWPQKHLEAGHTVGDGVTILRWTSRAVRDATVQYSCVTVIHSNSGSL